MKSLKKTLSLVLVLVMVLGMFGIASAAKFTDDATVQYKEAVDVMSGIGAIAGFPDGTFGPTKTITRAEAAKMVAYAVLGKELAESLTGVSSSFKDVPNSPAYSWAIPSIEYLVSVGAIAGDGTGNFNPTNNVTALELGKMLLVCLGIEGNFTGAGWDLQVGIAAQKAGLFAGRATGANALGSAASREETALYCFNALIYAAVGGTKTVTMYFLTPVAGATKDVSALAGKMYDSLAEGMKAANDEELGAALGTDYTLTPVTVEKENLTGSLAETVYGLDKAITTDSFGRPGARTWMYKNKPISTALTSTPVATFKMIFTKGDLFKAIGVAGDIDMYKNEVTGRTLATNGLNSTKNANAAADLQGGNGYVTEIYKVGSTGVVNDDYVAVQIVPTFGQVTSVIPHAAISTRGAYTTYVVSYASTTASGDVYTSVVDVDTDVSTAKLGGTISAGAMVLCYKDTNTLYINPVGTLTGVLSSVTSGGAITIGSTQTTAFGNPVTFAATLAGLKPSVKERSFFVDSNGFVIAEKDPTAGVAAIGLVVGAKPVSILGEGNVVTTSYLAVVAGPDGTVTTYPISFSDYNNGAPAFAGDVCSFEPNTANPSLYDFTPLNGGANTVNGVAVTANLGVTKITNKSAVLTGGTLVAVNNSTKFIITDYTAASLPAGTVTVYTGINTVPTLGDPTPLAATTAVDMNSDGIADAVFVFDLIAATAASNYIYVIGSYTATANGYEYAVIENGAYGTITLKTAQAPTFAGLYSQLTISNGAVVAGSTAKATPIAGTTIRNNNGILVYAAGAQNITIADNVPVFMIDSAAGSFTAGTAADLAGGANGTAIYVVTTAAAPTVAVAVYIVI